MFQLKFTLCSPAESLFSWPLTQAGVLTGPHLSLSTGLSLISKQQSSSCCNLRPASVCSRGSDQLRPIVQRFLESLPSVGKAWSFDAPSTVRSLGGLDVDLDSISVCSRSSLRIRRPATRLQGGKRPPAWQDAGVRTAAPPDSTPEPAALRVRFKPWASSGVSKPCSHHQAARCQDFAESTGSAPTPSPHRAAAAAEPVVASSASCSRSGVFVGNLPGDVTERTLVELFSCCGRIDRLWIARNPSSQASLGYGFVVFDVSSGPHATERAERELDGTLLHQQHICVRVSTRHF